jgi:hypothetical protein
MPWVTPTLEDLRALNRDNVQSQLRSGPMIPNSVLRVMSDSNAGLAYLTLLYLNWLALQLMPDTAETEWLDRFGNIWVGGRKSATFASGTVTVTGIAGTVLPNGSQLQGTVSGSTTLIFQTTSGVTVGSGPTPVNIVALTPGLTSLQVGNTLALSIGVSGLDGGVTITSYNDGVPQETDDELRVRVLDRIRQPPMGGDAFDYVEWALQVPGVTRAWCAPNEMGVGTITVRFMMDDLRAGPLVLDSSGHVVSGGGFPLAADVATALAYLQTLRPVAIKDFFVEAPLPWPINFTLQGLEDGSAATQANIVASVAEMLASKAAPSSSLNGVLQPATTIYAAWVSEAVLTASGVEYFDLVMSDAVPPNNGSLAVMGTITTE